MTTYFAGLISGTSMDGIDAVLADFSQRSVRIHASLSAPYPGELKSALLSEIAKPLNRPADPDGQLDRAVGRCFRDAALALIDKAGVERNRVAAIGSHGQTLRHQPDATPPFSLQIGDPKTISTGTGIVTIADFRSADIRAGGQGAPLVPPFHEWLLRRPGENRVVVNIGGIANITILPGNDDAVVGFDTGPGNGLMDRWILAQRGRPFDAGGTWAASGSVIESLLQRFLADPYFGLPAPKSTGFEYFNTEWIARHDVGRYDPADVQATLCEFSAVSIADAIGHCLQDIDDVFVCGGGVRNTHLMNALSRHLPDTSVTATNAVGLDADWVEATAFAWLAMRALNGEPGNLPTVTGAHKPVVLGEIHSP